MPKKKSNKLNDTDNIDWSKYPSHVTEVCHPNFYFGTGKFKFKNGDSYEGQYCAHRSGIVWREGQGTYKTNDGHCYRGKWDNDQLLRSPQTVIKYPNGVVYEGHVENGKYSGLGTYIPRKNIYILSSYENNKPAAGVELLDPNGNYWKGNATSTDEVLLLPENHFYKNLTYEKGLGRENIDSLLTLSRLTLKTMEPTDPLVLKELVFKKSTKTVNNFKESLLTYGQAINDVIVVRKSKSLPLKTKYDSSKALMEMFWSDKYKQSCLATPMIYPTVDMEAKEEKERLKYDEVAEN